MSKKPSSILLVRTSAIGDVIQSLPVLEYLLYAFPEAKIDWVVEEGIAPLLQQIRVPSCVSRPPLERILTTRTREWAKSPFSSRTRQEVKAFVRKLREVRYDLLFDLQGNTKSACVTALARAREKVGFGWNSVRERTNLLVTSKRFDYPPETRVREKYLGLVQSYWGDSLPFTSQGLSFQLLPEEEGRLAQLLPTLSGHFPTLMIAVGSKWQNKRLREEDLLSFLKAVTAQVDPTYLFIYGNGAEKYAQEQLAAACPGPSLVVGELSLPLWQSLMRHVDGVIAVDSAALHLAATTSTPTLSLFGPTSAALFKPPGEQHHAHQGTCPYGQRFLKQCPLLRTCATGACLRQMPHEELMHAFNRWFPLLRMGRQDRPM